MSIARSVSDADREDQPPGWVGLDAESLDRLEVEPGDAVQVQGERRTVARVSRAVDGTGLVAGDAVRRNAGVKVGDVATISASAVEPAESVRLSPPDGFRFDGDGPAIEELLRGRAVVRGDEVRASLFGGSLQVTFAVTAVAPSDPGLVTDDTDVVVDAAGPRLQDVESEGPVTFEDVGGLDEVIRRLRQLVQAPLELPELYDRLGGPPTGVLLYGPTGTGKTLLVRALTDEVDAETFRIADRETFADRCTGGVDTFVRTVRDAAPAVVVFDDLDVLAPADGSDATTRGRMRAFVDAVADDDRILVVGTTNSPDEVDPALRRGGRFEQELAVGVPDPEARDEILRVHTRGVALADDVDLTAVADRTHGFVGADLATLVRAAARHAVDRLPDTVEFAALPETIHTDARITMADFDAAIEEVTPSGMRDLRVEHPDVSYEDVGGAEDAKREVVRAVEWPLQHPTLFDHLASDPPTGVLLHGLPGTGKTTLAKAAASATEANFVAVKGPELLDRYVGESERAVREVFERARRHAPAVVFFDEIDALAPTRTGESDAEVVERVVSQLLTELDGIEPREDVIVIGATNRPDMVDPALLRPGRLEKVVEVPLPDREAREEIFRIHAEGVPLADVDFDRLASATDGYTGSDIEATVREASLLAMEEYITKGKSEASAADLDDLRVTHDHFRRALDVVGRSVSESMRDRYAGFVDEIDGRRGG